MKLAKVAFQIVFPSAKADDYTFEVKYSGRFSAYNANVRYEYWNKKFMFALSKEWKGVSDDIVVGLLQHLILKIRGRTKKTLNIELYESFLKNVNEYVKKDKVDLYLKEIYDNLNIEYFNGMLGECNLKWGSHSKRTLGHYSFGSDTITISRIFKELPESDLPLLQAVMHHEMLHKKHKFTSNGKNNRYHTTEFRKEERSFKDFKEVEKKIHSLVRSHKIQSKTIHKKKKGWLRFLS